MFLRERTVCLITAVCSCCFWLLKHRARLCLLHTALHADMFEGVHFT